MDVLCLLGVPVSDNEIWYDLELIVGYALVALSLNDWLEEVGRKPPLHNNTVEPPYKGQPWSGLKVAFVGRWPL